MTDFITSDDIRRALFGSEHGSNSNHVYGVSFAVPNRLPDGTLVLGASLSGYSSGFSFGVSQLDIGSNGYAQLAYIDILDAALQENYIDQATHTRLSFYNGKSRYDLPDTSGYSATYQSDQKILAAIAKQSFAKPIIDLYDNNYIGNSGGLQSQVNQFISTMNQTYGSNSVFDPSHAEYAYAVSAITSIANRTGGLTQSTDYFLNNRPDDLDDVRERYDDVLGDHWRNVLKGGEEMLHDDNIILRELDGEGYFDQHGWLYDSNDMETKEFSWTEYNPVTGQNETYTMKLTLTSAEATTVIDGETHFIEDIFQGMQAAADATSQFISAQAGNYWDNLTDTYNVHQSLVSFFTAHGQDLVNGDLSVQDALKYFVIELAENALADTIAEGLMSPSLVALRDAIRAGEGIDPSLVTTAEANDALAGILQEMGISNSAQLANGIYDSLGQMAVTFALNSSGWDSSDYVRAGSSVITGVAIQHVVHSEFGLGEAVGGGTAAALTTLVSGIINSGDFDSSAWANLALSSGIAFGSIFAASSLVGYASGYSAAVAAGLPVSTTLTAYVSGQIAAVTGAVIGEALGALVVPVVGILIGGLLGRIFGSIFGGASFGPGEYGSVQQVLNSVYQVQTITVEGQEVPALVAVNASGSTILASGTGIGYVIGNVGADVLVGGSGIQTISGNGGADYLEARAGNDNLLGGAGNDHLNGGEDDDILQGDDGDDLIFAEEGKDTVLGGAGNDFAHLGGGDDIAAGGTGSDYLLAGGGNDAVSGDAGNDSIDGGYGDDTITGGDGDDLILGNLGNDAISGDNGSDTIFGAEGSDQAYGGNGDDFVDGGAGIDLLYGDAGDDLIVGGADDDFGDGGLGDDNILGGTGNDVLLGGMDNDYLRGDEGNDTLTGGMGNDILVGGIGANMLEGGEGSDVYLVGSDIAEHDNIIVDAGVAGDVDTLLLTWLSQVDAENDLTLLKDDNDLIISHNGRVLATVTDQFLIAGNGIERIELAEGKYIDLSAVTYDPISHLGAVAVGVALAASVVADAVAMREDRVEDNLLGQQLYWNETFLDKLSQLAYDEQLSDQTIYHYYNGTEVESYKKSRSKFGGHYTVYKLDTPGNINGTEFVRLEFAILDAEDQAAAANFGNDEATLAGPYESFMNGATIVYSTFGGYNIQDIVVDGNVISTKVEGDPTLYTAGSTLYGATYAQRLTAGTTATSDIAVKKFGSDLLVGAYWDETIDGKSGDDVLVGNGGNDSIIGGDGNDWAFGGDGNDTLSGGNGDDQLFGGDGNDVMGGGADNDAILGSGGADTIAGDAGDDWIDGGTGNDYISAGDDNDILIGGEGDDILLGGAGNDVLHGNEGADSMLGGDGDDTLIGGVGADSLYGGAGNDVLNGGSTALLLDGGDGDDTIIFEEANANVANLESGSFIDDIVVGRQMVSVENITGSNLNDILYSAENANIIDGGVGSDAVSYGYSTAAVTVNLATGVNTGGYAQGDTLRNIENVIGSSYNDLLTGNTARNVLLGMDGNDTIIGGIGADFIDGGDGSDFVSYVNSAAAVNINLLNFTFTGGEAAGDYLTNVENIIGSAQADTIIGNTANNIIQAGSGNDSINGGEGNDTLDGGIGNDTLIGGLGDDAYYVDAAGDVITENASEGTDTAYSNAAAYTLGANIENLTLTGASAINGTGNALNNVLTGNTGNNILTGAGGNDTLDGGIGNDTLIGGLGDDAYYVDAASDVITENASEGTDTAYSNAATYTLGANIENLMLLGASAINGTGNTLANTITGNTGDNILDGGTGNDTMIGGLGNDTYYVDAAGDVINESADEGEDLVNSSVTYTLANNLERLTLTGAVAINGTGNALDNILTGNTGNNILTGAGGNDSLDGGTGNDTLIGGIGDDSYYVDVATDAITENASEGTDTVFSTATTYTLSTNVENLVLAGTASINGTGNSGNNVLTGNIGNNILNGGAGLDTLIGGLGDDTYIVDTITDTITENTGEGTDLVSSSVTYTLGDYLENLTLTGALAINGTGNMLDNVLTGNNANNILTGAEGNDTLDGGFGNDTLVGGLGDDSYYVDAAGDVITENASEGTDTVYSNASTYTLSANIENLTLAGVVSSGTGNALGNIITGNAADNVIDGSTGNDTMIGGLGNDTYYVDTVGDVITENAGEGLSDHVMSAITYTLGNNLERLTLTGALAINGTGNTENNFLRGNTANNILTGAGGNDSLDGGVGNDTLIGGMGNDMYYVDSASDVITENANEGIDIVLSTAASYTLGANIEELRLSTATAITGTGNALDNYILGTSSNNVLNGLGGNDTLDGGLGIDTMTGGLGDDTYYVNVIQDVVTEVASQGIDTVLSEVTYTLAANLENLTLTGVATINGTGNTSNNIITGNQAPNLLTGGDGSDTLYGGLSNDTLSGGNGDDWLDGGRGTDSIDGGAGTDTLSYAGSLSAVSVNLGTGAFSGGDAINDIVTNVENLSGSSFNDTLVGNTLANTISGASGADTLTGGLGADHFAYQLMTDAGVGVGNRDVITDFTRAQGDKINLSAFAGTLTFLGTGAFSSSANPAVRYFSEGSNTIVQVDSNDDNIADFEIQINGSIALTSADFVL